MAKKSTTPILLVGSAGDSADLRYASGFVALDPTVFLQHGRRRYLVAPRLELGRAHHETEGVTILTPEELPLSPKQGGGVAGWAVGLVKHLGLKRVAVAATFPLGVAARLKRAGISVQPREDPLYPAREKKSRKEIEAISEAQTAAVAAMQAAVRMIRRSTISRRGHLVYQGKRLTSERVRYAIETALLSRSCLATETIVAGGSQGADPHQRGYGPLRAGESIVIDIFPRHRTHGYWGDITRTVVKGTPSPALRRMYTAVKRAQAVALKKVKAGVTASTLHRSVQQVFTERGFETGVEDGTAFGFFHGTGHGVGLEIHEAPRIGLGSNRLRSGQVITIEPGLYYPELGGVRIEDTVVVTAKGFDYLATCDKRFEV